jgi:preprotein translocase subunit SecA
MSGRRWSDGLHQAVEAKEGAAIQKENQTLASITFQNLFRLYNKLSGMTGTADTEAYEFQTIYGLETVIIPTHRDMVRDDRMDQVFRTAQEKYDAVIADIKDCQLRGQPVLVGTTSIEINEFLSGLLKKEKLSHQLLNAKQHAREADIVAQAGRPGMITIATNMAGRGTDIVLGGNVEKQVEHIEADASIEAADKEVRIQKLRDEWQSLHDAVVKAGGLHIIGTERHESRRIDNQLRGRSGRQGDPGSSRFYMSLADPLLRIFAGDRINSIMQMLKMPEGEPIEAGIVTRSIESAQRKVEAHNFDIRKQLLEYDNVANDQRKIIYELRNKILEGQTADLESQVRDLRHGVLTDMFRAHVPEESVEEQWDLEAIEKDLQAELSLEVPVRKLAEAGADDEKILAQIIELADKNYQERFAAVPPDLLGQYERNLLLTVIDHEWREHLGTLDHLRQGIHLRGYAQKNPRQEYKREGFELFGAMLDTVKLQVTRTLMRVQVQTQEQVQQVEQQADQVTNVQYHHADYDEALASAATATEKPKAAPFVKAINKVGRNEPCPCGSGKKYKQCHGKLV